MVRRRVETVLSMPPELCHHHMRQSVRSSDEAWQYAPWHHEGDTSVFAPSLGRGRPLGVYMLVCRNPLAKCSPTFVTCTLAPAHPEPVTKLLLHTAVEIRQSHTHRLAFPQLYGRWYTTADSSIPTLWCQLFAVNTRFKRDRFNTELHATGLAVHYAELGLRAARHGCRCRNTSTGAQSWCRWYSVRLLSRKGVRTCQRMTRSMVLTVHSAFTYKQWSLRWHSARRHFSPHLIMS